VSRRMSRPDPLPLQRNVEPAAPVQTRRGCFMAVVTAIEADRGSPPIGRDPCAMIVLEAEAIWGVMR
jgi:hypothetical protein